MSVTALHPYADLTHLGAGHYEGRVVHHPASPILYVHTTTPSEKLIGLWIEYEDDGQTLRRLIGSGLMRQQDGEWRGVLSEGNACWHLSAQIGSGRVVMREK